MCATLPNKAVNLQIVLLLAYVQINVILPSKRHEKTELYGNKLYCYCNMRSGTEGLLQLTLKQDRKLTPIVRVSGFTSAL